MGRAPRIDRGKLLELAGDIVRQHGAKALTLEALAKAAGVTKGGVQYNFTSKTMLISEMVKDWTRRFDEVLDMEKPEFSEAQMVERYLEITLRSEDFINTKAVGALAAYLDEPENMQSMCVWHRSFLDKIDAATPDGRRARLAFLALEGAIHLRLRGITEEREWRDMLDGVKELLLSDDNKACA